MTEGEIKLRKIVFKWVIQEYTATVAAAIAKNPIPHPEKLKLKSPTLILNNSVSLNFLLYPHGNDKRDTSGYVSVFLQSSTGSFKGKVSYYILDCNDTEICKHTTPHRLFEKGLYRGYPKFARQSQLVLVGGNLVIGCDVETDPEELQNPLVKMLNSSILEKKLNKYEQLFETKAYSDVKFIMQGREIHGHKSIIASQSPVLAAMFESKMKECNDNVVDIADISYNVMYELLRFIYAGKVKEIENVAVELLIASEKYMIEELKTLCENYLSSILSSKNVVQYLNLAELHNASLLKDKGINFIAQYAETVADSPHFDVSELGKVIMREVFSSVAKSKKRKLND
ncbi:hypothetical protein QAD02_004568 [Eretmocerus hayati]|uniref:Uncharacterized protein n=1 Tax=Eretmocerus hayati TaxID=131215 RepID=A0ACC2NR02_9HYME|nr:hypothetical protein QAD02_004568 [Eretmocerus hayati]